MFYMAGFDIYITWREISLEPEGWFSALMLHNIWREMLVSSLAAVVTLYAGSCLSRKIAGRRAALP
jgi:hypothetical protein